MDKIEEKDRSKVKGKAMEVYSVPVSTEENKVGLQKKSFWSIDKKMVRFKVHFFFFFAAMGCVFPYMPVVARNRLGLSASALAATLTSQKFITLVSKPLIGYIADYFNKLKLMIGLLIIIQAICNFLILAIPPIRQPSSSTTNHFSDLDLDNETYVLTVKSSKWCENLTTKQFSISLNKHKEDNELKYNIQHDIICVGHVNQTSMNCFQMNTGKNKNDVMFNTETDGCCLTSYESIKTLNNEIYSNFSKYYFTTSSLHLTFSLKNVNKTIPCTVVFTEEKNLTASDFVAVSDFETYEYWIFAILFTISGICGSSLFTLADTACCESVSKLGGDFGRQRMFCAIGWGSMAPIAGLLCDFTDDYVATWILMAVMQCVTLWNLSKMDLIKPHYSKNILRDAWKVIKSTEFLAFELAVFLNGLGTGALSFYLVWFIASIGGSKFLCGMIQYVQCFVGEIPFMYFSGWFLKKLGHFNLISMSLMSHSLRFLWYSYLHNPWLVLPAEVAHGFTYGTFYPTVASFGKLSASPGTEATTQAILFTTHDGLGSGIGTVLAGIGFDYLGGHRTFFIVCLISATATLINVTNTLLLKRRSKTLNLDLKSISNKK